MNFGCSHRMKQIGRDFYYTLGIRTIHSNDVIARVETPIGNSTTKQFLYCAEGTIDRVLVRSSDMMMRYLKELNYVLREGLTDGLHAIVIEQERQLNI